MPTVGSTVTNSVICLGGNTTLNGTGANTYTWTGGVTNGVSFSPGSTVTYSLTGTSALGCLSSNTATRTVTVNPLPTVGSTTTNSVICLGGNSTLNGTGANTYTWTGGVTNGVSFSPGSTITYSLTGTSAAGCLSSNTAVATVTVNPLPTVGSTVTNSVICYGVSTTLNGTGASTYTWTGGVTNGVAFAPASTLAYTVTGTAAVTGCTNTSARTITVNPLPIVSSTTSNSVVCFGVNTTLNGTGASTYTWTGGVTDGVAFAPSSTTTYTVNGTSAAGCTNTNVAIRTITVNPLPVVSGAVTNSIICYGAPTTLNGSGASTYTWTGGVTDATAFNPSSTANYSLSGTDAAGCTSTNSAVYSVTVNPLPVVTANSSTTSICDGFPVTLTGGSADTYTWTGGVSNGIAFVPPATASYSVSGTNTLTGCTSTNSAFQTITVNSIPTVTGSASSPVICLNNSTSLSGSGAATYTWTGGVTNAVAFNPTISATYSVTGTSAAGCTSTNNAAVSITVNPLPNVTASTSNSVFCFGNSATLTASGALLFTWNPGSLVGSVVTVTPTTTTIYVVTGTDGNSCQNTAAVTQSVHQLPIVTASASNPVICINATTSLVGGAADTYTWSPAIPNATPFSPISTTTYTLAGTNTLTGCTSTNLATQVITVNPLPIVSASTSNSVICFGVLTSLNGSGATTYTWTGGVTNGASFSPTITATYSVVGTDANGCTSTNTAVQGITVNPLPPITATTNSASICAGFSTTLTSTGADTYTWTPGLLNGAVVTVTPGSSTAYAVTGTNTLTGCTNATLVSILVNPLPFVNISASSLTLCVGSTSTLTAGGASTYTWNPGPTVSNSITVSPASLSSYSVSGTSAVGCLSSNTAVATVTVLSLPTVTAAVNNPVLCFGNSATLSASGAVSYSWNPGGLTGTTINLTPPITTNYSLTGTDVNGCTSTNTAVQTITVNPLPFITVTSATPGICQGFSTSITASNADTYTWNPGALSGNSIVINPSSTTSYTVSGTNTLTGCASTNLAVQTITVDPLPTVTGTLSNQVICVGSSATLTSGGANTYTWNPGALNGSLVTVNPLTTTIYTLTGRSTVGCLSSNSVILTITVNPLPSLLSTISNSVFCFGAATTLSATGADTYTWTGGITNGVSFTPTISGTYSVSGTNTLTGCVNLNASMQSLTVNPLPVVTAVAASPSVCAGSSVTITGGNADTYTWNPGNLSGTTITVTPAINTNYTVVGTNTLTGCSSTNLAVQTISASPLPTVSSSVSNSIICFGDLTTLNGSGAATYSWSGGATNGTPFSPGATLTYTLTGYSAAGCTNTNLSVQSITVNSLPIVTANTNSPSVCLGFSTTLTGAGATTYTWTGGVLNAVSFSPSATGSYTVTGTDANNCQNIANITITVNPIPVVTASATSTVVCFGESVTLSGSGANTYSWTGGVTDGVAFTPSITASYSAVGISSAGCTSTNTAVVTVTVNQLPIVTASVGAAVICSGYTTSLTGGGATTYSWSGNVQNGVVFTPTSTSDYTLTGTDSNNCQNTVTANITVNPLPSLTVTSSNPILCESETVTLTASGASSYSWSNLQSQASIVISPTVTTSYTVIGITTSGCSDTTLFVQTVTVCPGVLTATSTAKDVTCFGKKDGSINIESTISYQNKKVDYYWLPAGTCLNNACSELNNLGPNTYSLTIKVTYTLNNFLVKTDSIVLDPITVLDINPECEATVFTGISLNNDGTNDFLTIDNIELFPKNRITVFNRWGVQIFEQSGYDNKTVVWPTSDQAAKLISGTYFYVVDLGDGSKPQKGWIELFKN